MSITRSWLAQKLVQLVRSMRVAVTIVDAAGEISGFARQDGAAAANFDISYGQAYTVIKFGGMSGANLEKLADYNWFRSASSMRGGRLMAAIGSLAFKRGDEVIGAVGVSGAPAALSERTAVRAAVRLVKPCHHDLTIAEAAVAALG